MNKCTLKSLWPAFRRDLRERPQIWWSRLAFILGPWVCLWMVEILNKNNVFTDLYDW